MSLYGDVAYMLSKSQVSQVKIDKTLRMFRKKVFENGEATVYKGFADRVKYNLCCARFLQGNYSEWDGWQYRDEWAEAMRYGQKDVPMWTGEYVDKLVIIGEQGVGDEVLWGTVIPECQIRVKEVTYACDERLVDIFKRSLRINTKTRYVDARTDLIGDYDAFICSGDLLPLFRRRKADFPRKAYLKVSPERVREFEKYRGMTGISWKGRHGFIDPMALGIEKPVSLQYDDFDRSKGIEHPDLDLKNDLEGVLALISVLGKVVTVPTSVMHFAGALGVPTEVIITQKESEIQSDGVYDETDWHVPLGESPFYPNQYIFRDIIEWKHKNSRSKKCSLKTDSKKNSVITLKPDCLQESTQSVSK